MTQEQKDILLKDLCMRLPYGVICKSVNFKNPTKLVSIDLDGPSHDVYFCTNDDGAMWNDYDEIKPYLLPLSSMTEEQKEEYVCLQQRVIYNGKGPVDLDVMKYINWCYKHHIDINGLIPMGLANDATGLNIY